MIATNPPKTCTTFRLSALAILLGAISSPVGASDREAAAQVREGVRLHLAGDFEQAAKAFSQAAESLPTDPRIAFNQGCALAAQGKHDEAESLLRSAALARDTNLAAAANYNLGCLAADQMKTLFGDQPEEAVDPIREEGLLLVRTAVDHYRNALRANPEHTAARRNLELLRVWSKHIQDRWAQRDRERRREAMNVLEFLAWLQDEQRGARRLAKDLPSELNSPTRRQTVRKLSATQRDLTIEIEPLKVKLEQALQPPPDPASPTAQSPTAQSPTVAPPAPQQALSPQMQQARQFLHALADQAGQSMTHAADELEKRNITGAIAAQTEVLPPLNQLFEFLAPFEAILQTAIKSETSLVEASTPASAPASANAVSSQHATDFEEAAEDQRYVSGWAEMLIQKAKQRLAEAGPADDVPPETDGPTEIPLPSREPEAAPATPTSTDATSTDATAAPPVDPNAAYEKTLELGPRIKNLTAEAAANLQQQDWSAALPRQEEALQLLKEIAALLPPPEKQDEENQEQQDQENQDDQEKQDQEREGEQDKPADDEQKKKQDQDNTDSKQKADEDKKKSDEDRKQSQKEPGQPEESLSRRQAESLLRQVREREREHREFEKEIRRLLRSRIIVEKDW